YRSPRLARRVVQKPGNVLRCAQQRSAVHSCAQANRVEQTNPPRWPVKGVCLAQFEKLKNEPTLSYKRRPKVTRFEPISPRIILPRNHPRLEAAEGAGAGEGVAGVLDRLHEVLEFRVVLCVIESARADHARPALGVSRD